MNRVLYWDEVVNGTIKEELSGYKINEVVSIFQWDNDLYMFV